MSNPFTQVYDDLRSPYLHEKKAKKDYDGDGKIETGSKEHAGAVHNAIQKKKGGKADGQDTRSEGTAFGEAPRKQKGAMAYDGPNKKKSEAADRVLAKTKAKRAKMKKEDWRADLGIEIVEHHKTDADGNVIPHEEEADGTPSSVEEATKGDKLEIKTTGVKNKIEINPTVQTEARDRLLEKMSQASKNVGTEKCWSGYKRAGTQMKKGKVVPKCEKESLLDKVESDALKMLNAK